VLCRFRLELKLPLHDQPTDVPCPAELEDFFRAIRIDGMVEHKHREARMPSAAVIKQILAGDHQQSILPRNLALRKTKQLLELWNHAPRTESPYSAGKLDRVIAPSERFA